MVPTEHRLVTLRAFRAPAVARGPIAPARLSPPAPGAAAGRPKAVGRAAGTTGAAPAGSPPAAAGTGAAKGVARVAARLAARFAAAVARELRIRRDTRQLMAMSDHMLMDIGLTRADISAAARYGRD